MSETLPTFASVQSYDSPIDRAVAAVCRAEAKRIGRHKTGAAVAAAYVELAELYEDKAAVRDAAENESL